MVMQNSVILLFEAHSAMICTSNDRSTLIKMQKINSIERGWVNFKQRNLNYPTKHDVKDIIKTFEDYLQILQTKTSRHQNVNNL